MSHKMSHKMMSHRVVRTLALVFLVVVVIMAGVPTAQAQEPQAWASTDVNVRSGPGKEFGRIGVLRINQPVFLEGRDEGEGWILIRTPEGLRGWVAYKLLTYAGNIRIRDLPVSTEQVAAPAAPVGGGEAGAPPPAPVAETSTEALNAAHVPTITPQIRSAMRAVAARGRANGANSRVFAKVGDCMTDHWGFLNVIGYGQYNLGEYGYLQEVINNFNVSPREGVGNSFDVDSLAAHNGFNSAAVLDDQWADPSLCQQGESPLECEYRLNKPAVAIIMFGTADVIVMNANQFNVYIRDVVKKTMDAGIVPILTTFPENRSLPDRSRAINQVIVGLGREKGIPVINLADAVRGLPDGGIDATNLYLTLPPDGATGVFDAGHLQYGYTVRNLLTLQTLDRVWRQILN
jgi:uncharacterized protein YraI